MQKEQEIPYLVSPALLYFLLHAAYLHLVDFCSFHPEDWNLSFSGVTSSTARTFSVMNIEFLILRFELFDAAWLSFSIYNFSLHFYFVLF